MSNELAVMDPGVIARAVMTFDQIKDLAKVTHESGLFAAWKSPQQVAVAMMFGQVKGLHPMEVMEQFDLIQGRMTIKASAMMARFRAAGGRVEWTEVTDKRVSGTFTARDGSSISVSWDMERATKAGLTGKDTWKQHPQSMLQHRCTTQAIRAIAPEVIFGLLADHEAEDLPPLRAEVRPAPPVQQIAQAPKVAAPPVAAATRPPLDNPIKAIRQQFRSVASDFYTIKDELGLTKLCMDLVYPSGPRPKLPTEGDYKKAMEILLDRAAADKIEEEIEDDFATDALATDALFSEEETVAPPPVSAMERGL